MAVRRSIWLVAGAALLGPPPATGAGNAGAPAPAPDLGRAHQFTDLVEDAGLRGRYIMDVDFERDGTAWLATADGARRYDGYRWRRFSTDDGLPSNFVRAVCVTRRGEVWAGTDHGVARFDGNAFAHVDGPPAGPNVRRIVEDADGTLWFCCDTWQRLGVPSGLSARRDGGWRTWRRDEGLPSDYVLDVFRAADGRLFALTLAGLARWEADRWVGVAGSAAEAWTMIEGREGPVAATEDAILAWRDGAWHRSPPADHVTVAKSMFRHGDELFAASSHPHKRLLRRNGDRFEPIGDVFSTTGVVETAEVSPDGSVWLVGYDLLVRWAPSRGEWQRFPDLPPPRRLDPSGHLWFVSEDGAVVLGPDGWRRETSVRGSVRFDTAGRAWSWHDGVVTMTTGEAVLVHPSDATGLHEVRAVHPDPEGGVWGDGRDASGATVVSRYGDGAWQRWTPSGLGTFRLHDAVADGRGGLLLVLDDVSRRRACLGRFADGRLEILPLDLNARHGGRLCLGDDQRPWVCGEFGAYVREATGWRRVPELPGRAVSEMVGRRGELWFVSSGAWGGSDGLSVLSDAGWRHHRVSVRRYAGRSPNDALHFIGTDGGLFTAPANGRDLVHRRFPPTAPVARAFGDASGDLWLKAGKNVYRYRPDGIPPETVVTDAPAEVIVGHPMKIGVHGVERFRARAGRHLDFSWRFDDGPWSPFGPLPPEGLPAPSRSGTHALEIRARDEGLDVDPTPARVSVRVLPLPLQARAWFLPVTVALLGTIGLLATIAGMSRRKIRSYARRLEATVARRTRDLRTTDATLRAAFDNLPFDVWVCDTEGRYLRQNASSVARSGDRIGRHPSELELPDDLRRRGRDAHRRALAGEIVTAEVTRKADGRIGHFYNILAPIRDEETPIGVVGIDIDITERKRAEGRLRNSQRRFRTLAEASPSIIFQADRVGRAVYMNDRWAETCGLGADAWSNDGWLGGVHPSDRAATRRTWREAVRSREPWRDEFRFRHVDGRVTWVLAQAVPIRTPEGGIEGFIGGFTDITERKMHERRQRLMMNELDHRVKNNLSVVMSFIALTKRSCRSIDEFVETLTGWVRSMADTHEALAAAHWQGLGVDRVVRGTLFASDAVGRRVSADGPPIVVRARAVGPLSMCLHELGVNAARHGALAQPTGHVEVEWKTTADDEMILEWRETVEGTIAGPTGEGVGLGLVRGLVERELHGSLSLEFRPRGLVCRIRMPLTEDDSAEPASDPPGE